MPSIEEFREAMGKSFEQEGFKVTTLQKMYVLEREGERIGYFLKLNEDGLGWCAWSSEGGRYARVCGDPGWEDNGHFQESLERALRRMEGTYIDEMGRELRGLILEGEERGRARLLQERWDEVWYKKGEVKIEEGDWILRWREGDGYQTTFLSVKTGRLEEVTREVREAQRYLEKVLL